MITKWLDISLEDVTLTDERIGFLRKHGQVEYFTCEEGHVRCTLEVCFYGGVLNILDIVYE